MKEPNEIKNKHLRYTSKTMYVLFLFFFNSQSIDSGFFLTLFLLSSAFTQFGLISLSTSLLSLYHCLCHFVKDFCRGTRLS